MFLTTIIGALIIAILAVVFSIQNALVITISFFVWKFEGSLALILLSVFFLGFIVGLLILLPGIIKKGLLSSNQRKKIEELQKSSKEGTDKSIS
jgi:uncharacterized integral membrane protein